MVIGEVLDVEHPGPLIECDGAAGAAWSVSGWPVAGSTIVAGVVAN